MSCCGKKREQSSEIAPNQQNLEVTQNISSMPRLAPKGIVYFEYVGQTGLTVIGPITGRQYRFDSPAAVVAIDERDSPSLTAVPNLRQMKST